MRCVKHLQCEKALLLCILGLKVPRRFGVLPNTNASAVAETSMQNLHTASGVQTYRSSLLLLQDRNTLPNAADCILAFQQLPKIPAAKFCAP